VTLRALARGSLLVTAGNLVPRAGAFLLLPIYAHFLTRADFGTVSLASSAALLLAITYRLGLDAALLRLHHDLPAPDRRALYATIAAICVACAASVTLLVALASIVLGRRLGDGIVPVVLLALGIGAFNTFQFVPSVWFRATDQTGRYLVVALAAFAVVALVTVALVVALGLGAVGSLTGQLAGAIVMAAVAVAILWAQRPWSYRSDLARTSLDFGLPLLPHTLAGWLLNVSDRWILGLLLGLAAADALAAIGVYSMGYQLAYAIGLIAVSFNAAWLPFLYRVGETSAGPAVVAASTTIVIAGFLGMAGVLAVIAPDVIDLIAPPSYAAAADVTVVVAFASALNAASLMLASGVYLVRDTRRMPLLTFVAAATNVVLNIVLIPRLGIMGAAWSTLAAYGVLAVLTGWLAAQRYPLTLDVARLAAAALITVGAAFAARAVWPAGSDLAAAAHVALALVVVVGIGLVVRTPARRLRTALATTGPQPRAGPGAAAGLG
jgi:O-antigen/teichoic acid export membrane protein